MVAGSIVGIIVRVALMTDLDSLLCLNEKWQKVNLSNLKDGYVGAVFAPTTFLELMDRKQVVVADLNGIIVGYYLLNNYSREGIIGKHELIVSKLRGEGLFGDNDQVCVGAQAVVDTDYMGKGIRQAMLTKLTDTVKNKYQFLFATIAKDNLRAYKAHTNDGWKVLGEDGQLYYVVYKIPLP